MVFALVPGEIAKTKSIKIYRDTLQLTFSPPNKKSFFNFILLGISEGEKFFNATEALNSFGWLSKDQTAEYALQFSRGEISAGKLGELLGLKPEELHDFKNRCGAFEEKST